MTSALYDRDIAVIGGGPAGLAAAIRVRWVKGFEPVPSSVAVFDPGPLGGLAGWGSCVLTGPSFSLTGEEIVGKLVADVDALSIPHIQSAVRRIRREGTLYVLEGDSFELRCLAVVLATGFRALSREGQYFPDGVVIAMKGRTHLAKLIERAHLLAAERHLVVVGGRGTSLLGELLAPLASRPGGLSIVLEQSDPQGLPPVLGPCTTEARVVGLSGDARLESVLLEHADGSRSTRPCGALFLDYHAFEIEPVLTIEGLDEVGVAFTPSGFVEIDAHGRTSCSDITAAGDVTGRYASTLTALGDGVVAGFSAYRSTYIKKFGNEPDLFAYRGTNRPLAQDIEEPPLTASARPLLVGDPERATADLARVLDDDLARQALEAMDGTRTLGEIERALDTPPERMRRALRGAMHARSLTVHVLRDGPAPPLGSSR